MHPSPSVPISSKRTSATDRLVRIEENARWRGGKGKRLSETAGLAFGLEEAEDIIDLDWLGSDWILDLVFFFFSRVHTWPLDVADDATRGIIHEFDADLGDTTARALIVSFSMHQFNQLTSRRDVPVRPRTRVTLTSLTGCLAESMMGMDADGGGSRMKEWKEGVDRSGSSRSIGDGEGLAGGRFVGENADARLGELGLGA